MAKAALRTMLDIVHGFQQALPSYAGTEGCPHALLRALGGQSGTVGTVVTRFIVLSTEVLDDETR